MIQIISRTPAYVWALLVYLIWIGLKARKTHIISFKTLLIMPTVMFVWSIYTVWAHPLNGFFISYWLISTALGIWMGYLTTKNFILRFDKKRPLIEMSGSWTPLVLSMSIFSLKYLIGMIRGGYPGLQQPIALWIIENVATIISGMFLGRLIGYWRRARNSPHNDFGVRVSEE